MSFWCQISRPEKEELSEIEAKVIEMIGGPDRDQTDDLFHAMEISKKRK
jgi:hypothetical protein